MAKKKSKKKNDYWWGVTYTEHTKDAEVENKKRWDSVGKAVEKREKQLAEIISLLKKLLKTK